MVNTYTIKPVKFDKILVEENTRFWRAKTFVGEFQAFGYDDEPNLWLILLTGEDDTSFGYFATIEEIELKATSIVENALRPYLDCISS